MNQNMLSGDVEITKKSPNLRVVGMKKRIEINESKYIWIRNIYIRLKTWRDENCV